MHIHPPKEGFKSLRGFLKELFTITCGVLIALSLEGVHQSIHQRHLVHEARVNILNELRDNQARVHGVAAKRPEELANLKRVILLCRKELARRGSVDIKGEDNLILTFTATSISSTCWGAAQSMGAVGLMGYQEVKRYKSIYELQDLFLSVQAQAVDRSVQLQPLGLLLDTDPDFRSLTPEELVHLQRTASDAYAYTSALASLIPELDKVYAEVLAAEQKPHA